mgnify:CR=1 FL=1
MFKKVHNGMTLVELLMVVAIIGIIAAVAYPSYTDSVVRSNRAEAQRELLRIANLQEQYFIDHRSYVTDMTKLGLSADPFVTESGNYKIDGTVSGVTFKLTATAQGTQATKDSSCTTLSVEETGKKTASGSDCWE